MDRAVTTSLGQIFLGDLLRLLTPIERIQGKQPFRDGILIRFSSLQFLYGKVIGDPRTNKT